MQRREQQALGCVTRGYRAPPGAVSRRERVTAVGRQRTVLVRFCRAVLRPPVNARGLARGLLAWLVTMGVAGVHQLAMLGASRVLDEEHVTGTRARQEQGDEAQQDARPPNHR